MFFLIGLLHYLFLLLNPVVPQNAGDIMQYNGSQWLRTPVGASGKYLSSNGTTIEWVDAPGGSGLPSGGVMLIITGACPVGYTEVTELNGKFVLGTLNGNGDIAETGGSDNITSEGTNSAPTFTGSASTVIVNHTHGLTSIARATTGGATTAHQILTATNDTSSTATAAITDNPSSGEAASYTPVGSNSAPTFTGTSFSNRPAFVKVIFCKKNIGDS